MQQLQSQLQQHQQQQQQQPMWPQVMQEPQMLQSVPMLLDNSQQKQPHMPGVSLAAAAAVSAALGAGQQQHAPLMWSQTPPGDPTLPFRAQGVPVGAPGSIMLLQHGVPASYGSAGAAAGGFNLRYGSSANTLQQSPHQPAAFTPAATAAAAAATRQVQLQQPLPQPQGGAVQQQHLQQSVVPAGQQGSSEVVLRRVSSNAESWGSTDTTIYFRVEGLSLSADALADPAVWGRHVLLAHMLLEDFTSPVQQCTDTAVAQG
jgi:hypothetical protein